MLCSEYHQIPQTYNSCKFFVSCKSKFVTVFVQFIFLIDNLNFKLISVRTEEFADSEFFTVFRGPPRKIRGET